jgi:RHS repeat-associated protein
VASKHVFVDGERLATKVTPDPTPPSEKVYYYHPDHLGSANFVTDEAGTSFEHLEYFPSGELWVSEHSDTQRTPYLFSGKELDDETGLSYFGARYYDARTGQWISADPILDEMLQEPASDDVSPAPFHASGQMTAYVANDPVDLTDPDGLVKVTKLSKLPPPRTSTSKRLKALHAKRVKKFVSMYGDRDVKYEDPPTGRRKLNMQSYAYEENDVRANVAISHFPKGSTRAQHFGYADKVMSERLKRKFHRSEIVKWNATVSGPGTWHHELLTPTSTMSFVPRDLHQQLGHLGGFSYIYK